MTISYQEPVFIGQLANNIFFAALVNGLIRPLNHLEGGLSFSLATGFGDCLVQCLVQLQENPLPLRRALVLLVQVIARDGDVC